MLDRPDRISSEDRLAQSVQIAEEASLVHVNDGEPGISRRRSGSGFAYKAHHGGTIRHAKVLDRIRSLAIPPAWTDVWISADAAGHVQATGRDVRGRKQYRYHPQWSVSRGEVKFSSLVAFADALPLLRACVEKDLRRQGLPREKVVASVVWLLDNTMIRVGNAAYARDNKSFGLTTLRDRHVDIKGSTLRFSFKGKSGKEWRIRLVDCRMARIIRGVQDIPGQQLFQYIDEDGFRRGLRSQDVNDYIRGACGPAFSSKHFRTWGGTITAASHFAVTAVPETKSARLRAMNEVIDRVASHLGNTRAVCRKCYIHPRVMERWSEGTLAAELAKARRSLRKATAGLDEGERVVMRWLKQG